MLTKQYKFLYPPEIAEYSISANIWRNLDHLLLIYLDHSRNMMQHFLPIPMTIQILGMKLPCAVSAIITLNPKSTGLSNADLNSWISYRDSH